MLTNDIVEIDVVLNNKNLPTIKILHDPIITLKQTRSVHIYVKNFNFHV